MDPYLVRCCSPCIAAQSLTSSRPMASDAINTPMTLSSTIAMRIDNTASDLSILAACTTDVKQWYMQNGLQLNPDKS